MTITEPIPTGVKQVEGQSPATKPTQPTPTKSAEVKLAEVNATLDNPHATPLDGLKTLAGKIDEPFTDQEKVTLLDAANQTLKDYSNTPDNSPARVYLKEEAVNNAKPLDDATLATYPEQVQTNILTILKLQLHEQTPETQALAAKAVREFWDAFDSLDPQTQASIYQHVSPIFNALSQMPEKQQEQQQEIAAQQSYSEFMHAADDYLKDPTNGSKLDKARAANRRLSLFDDPTQMLLTNVQQNNILKKLLLCVSTHLALKAKSLLTGEPYPAVGTTEPQTPENASKPQTSRNTTVSSGAINS